MKVTLDLNVILDVVLERGEFLAAAEVLSLCKRKTIEGYIPSHGIPTIFYILNSRLGREQALATIDTLIDTFTVIPIDNKLLRAARSIGTPDFEDAIVIAEAQFIRCDYIITMNLKDFRRFATNVLTPEEFIHNTSGTIPV